jgi:hypothetical protein
MTSHTAVITEAEADIRWCDRQARGAGGSKQTSPGARVRRARSTSSRGTSSRGHGQAQRGTTRRGGHSA